MDVLLRTEKLKKRLGGFTLGPVSLEVPKGSIVGLIGRNGAGKTTFIKSVLGLLHPQGTVELLPDTPPKWDVRQDLGIVLGKPQFPGSLYCAQISNLMEMVYDRWSRDQFYWYTFKYGIPQNTGYKSMSAGTQMMLNLIIALSHSPRLLILDEPAANLDPVARDNINDLLFEFTREEDHGILVSSHIISDLERVCDYIAFLHNGKLLFFQEKDRLLERYGLFHCTPEALAALPSEAVKGLRHSQYGEEVLIDRQVLPQLPTNLVSVEDIMVLMARGVER